MTISLIDGAPVYPHTDLYGNRIGPEIGVQPSWGSKIGSGLYNASLAAGAVTGLMGAYNGYQQNKLLKRQFNASLADRNQNIANQALTMNDTLRKRAHLSAQMMGYDPRTNPEGHAKYMKEHQVVVDGSPIRG